MPAADGGESREIGFAMVSTVRSADGTTIAYDDFGQGPAVVVVGGALMTRSSPMQIIQALAEKFHVFSYDRRGRGDSGDHQPYAIEREFEDLVAVIEAAGGRASVFGMSSGSFIALETVASGANIDAVAVYEPPYLTASPDAYLSASDYGTRLRDVLAEGHPDQAVELFLRQVSGGWFDEGLKSEPWWPGMVALGPSLQYDAALTGEGDVPVDRLRAITAPTLVMYGGKSYDWAHKSVEAIAGAVPNASVEMLPDQDHRPDERMLADAVATFFTKHATDRS